MDHQDPRLRVEVPNTYWIIDVFGYSSLSTITAFIKVLAWLMELYAESFRGKPLRSLWEVTMAVEIYLATTEAHFLFTISVMLLIGTHQSHRLRCRRSGTVEPPSAHKYACLAASPHRDWCTPVGSSVCWLQSEGGVLVIKKGSALNFFFFLMFNQQQFDEVFINWKPFSKYSVKQTAATNLLLKK